MIYGYSKLAGGISRAYNLLALMPERDSVSWNTMISILSHHGRGADFIGMFVEMLMKGLDQTKFHVYGLMSNKHPVGCM